jgi:SAM-dependent methyltransferase
MTHDAKQRVIDYYNQEAAGYIEQYQVPALEQEFYPANDIRLAIVIDRLAHLGCRTVLDIGCGSGGPLLRMLAEGFDARGVDFAPAMVECAKQTLAAAGHDPQRVIAGDIEDMATLPAGRFDAVVATGVFPHNLDDRRAYDSVRQKVAAHGIALIEYRNELMSLASLNTYSYQFFAERLLNLAGMPEELAAAVDAFLADRFAVPPVDRERGKKVRYSDILARFHNPLTLGSELGTHGFELARLHFYHFHCAPPHFEVSEPRQFRSASLALENPSDWRGYFLASAFVAELRPARA